MKTTTTPTYLALDKDGKEYKRNASTIGELPTSTQRMSALAEATKAIATQLHMIPMRTIPFGCPVFSAFEELNRPKAVMHIASSLLLMRCEDIPLAYCTSFN